MKKAFGFAVAATMVIGGVASADVLYHNPVGDDPGGAIDQEFGDFPQYSIYLVADMNIPDLGGGGVTLTQVTGYFTTGNGNWGDLPTARLHLFPKVANLPLDADDPATSMVVNVSYDVNTGIMTTIGLNHDVAAGDYWIGLTPQGDFGIFGQEWHRGGANANGEIDAYRNPGGGYDFPPRNRLGPPYGLGRHDGYRPDR